MSLDTLPNELITLIAHCLDGRALYALILSARRFYVNGDLMNLLYRKISSESRREWCLPLAMTHAAFLGQTPAFIGLFNAWVKAEERSLRQKINVYLPEKPKLNSDFEKWRHELRRKSQIFGFETSILHVACHANSIEMMKFALSVVIDPLVPDEAGYTPLHIAAAGGKIEAIQFLLAARAKVDASASRRRTVRIRETGSYSTRVCLIRTPFHSAVENNQMSAAELLLDAGADHLATTIDDDDALTLAIRGCVDIKFLHYLLELGYNSSSLHRALLKAAKCGDTLRGKILLDVGARVSFNCVLNALNGDYVSMVGQLLDYGADLFETEAAGRSLLYFARSVAAARVLLEKEPCITTVEFYPDGVLSHLRDPRTPADRDWRNTDIDVVPLTIFLIGNGCTVDDKTMLWAAKAGTLPILEAFKKQHRPFMYVSSIRDDSGNTPLHLAMFVESGYQVEWIKFLLELGFDPNAVNKQGETPLLYAFGRDLHGAIPAELDVIMELLIGAGLDISAQASDGSTACHRALKNGDIWVAHFLLDAGADIHSFDRESETTLHAAVRGGYMETTEKIIQMGADMSAITKKKETVLHLAVRGAIFSQPQDECYLKTLACTVKCFRGVSIEVQAKGDVTSKSGHLELIRWLVRQEAVEPSATNTKGHTAFDIIKLHEPDIDWDYLDSLGVAINDGEQEQVTAQLVRWATRDVDFEMDDLDGSFENLWGLSIFK